MFSFPFPPLEHIHSNQQKTFKRKHKYYEAQKENSTQCTTWKQSINDYSDTIMLVDVSSSSSPEYSEADLTTSGSWVCSPGMTTPTQHHRLCKGQQQRTETKHHTQRDKNYPENLYQQGTHRTQFVLQPSGRRFTSTLWWSNCISYPTQCFNDIGHVVAAVRNQSLTGISCQVQSHT